MFVSYKWFILWSLWAARYVRQPTPVRRLHDGSLVRGQYSIDSSYQRYTGIPYASSEYKYRFKGPGPAPKWEGIFEATREHIRCPQRNFKFLPSILGTEDCLTINVYSPNHAFDGAPLPVMVFIHGGGFKEGSGSSLLYGPDFLVAKGVVIVTFNYRLNVHGFLCLGIKDAPGNAGLKDQVAALKWVQKNIRAFGGDPDNVTIFGESAGGASVSYHLVSPMSQGLFRRAIAQSGSSLSAFARKRDPLAQAVALAKSMGLNVNDPQQLYDIFMNKTLTELVNTELPQVKGRLQLAHLPFVPCTEQPIDGVEPFLTDTPFNILTKGDYNKVPVIIGSNSEEEYYFASLDTEETLKNLSFKKSMEVFDLEFPSEKKQEEVANNIRKLYMGRDEVAWETIAKLSRFYGEPYFNLPDDIETDLILKTSDKPVYKYQFQYSGMRNIPKFISGLTFWTAPGATHADELFYLFNLFPIPIMFETEMIRTMTNLWTNFAKYGTPTPEGSEFSWPPTSLTLPTRLDINEQLSIVHNPPVTETVKYWRQLYEEYRAP